MCAARQICRGQSAKQMTRRSIKARRDESFVRRSFSRSPAKVPEVGTATFAGSLLWQWPCCRRNDSLVQIDIFAADNYMYAVDISRYTTAPEAGQTHAMHARSSFIKVYLKWRQRAGAVRTIGKLSSVEDRGQTDRVTALPRPYVLDIDL